MIKLKKKSGVYAFVRTWTRGCRTNPKSIWAFLFPLCNTFLPFTPLSLSPPHPLVFVCSYWRKTLPTPKHLEKQQKSKTGPFLTIYFLTKIPSQHLHILILLFFLSHHLPFSLPHSTESVLSPHLFTDNYFLS